MKMRAWSVLLILSSLAISPGAWADRHDDEEGYDRHYAAESYPASGRHEQRHYRERHSETVYAKVVAVEPLTEWVRVAVPRRECWQEEVTYRERGGDPATGMVLGGIIGGVLGDNLRTGRHHDEAVIAGTLLGAAIGRDLSRGPDSLRTAVEKQCRVVEDYEEEERIVGYDVTYRYCGRLHHTRTKEHPGRRIRVTTIVGD